MPGSNYILYSPDVRQGRRVPKSTVGITSCHCEPVPFRNHTFVLSLAIEYSIARSEFAFNPLKFTPFSGLNPVSDLI